MPGLNDLSDSEDESEDSSEEYSDEDDNVQCICVTQMVLEGFSPGQEVQAKLRAVHSSGLRAFFVTHGEGTHSLHATLCCMTHACAYGVTKRRLA